MIFLTAAFPYVSMLSFIEHTFVISKLWRKTIQANALLYVFCDISMAGFSIQLGFSGTAYEFTLEHVGIDFNSSQIWMDYINFLASSEVISSVWRVCITPNVFLSVRLWMPPKRTRSWDSYGRYINERLLFPSVRRRQSGRITTHGSTAITRLQLYMCFHQSPK